MPFQKKIVIIIIILLFIYILYRLYRKQMSTKENFFSKTAEQELDEIKNNDLSPGITSLKPVYTNMPISQYVIKGSYNTAVTDNYVSLDTLKYVLSRGCRFIDFEVFFVNNRPVVSYSNDQNFKLLETDNTILLEDILSNSIAYGFNEPSPNPTDPLFIQLRIKSTNNDVYNEVAKTINTAISNRLYTGEFIQSTKLSEIMGKVVIVLDKTINYNYQQYTNCSTTAKNCYDLKNYINIESGSQLLRTNNLSTIISKSINPPSINDNNITTDVTYMQIASPDVNTVIVGNPLPYEFIKDYGCQILLYKFYNKDNGLELYEEMFKENLYGIVPLATMLMYFSKYPDFFE
jgi:hypothetical protein